MILESEDKALESYRQLMPALKFKGTFLFNYGAELYEMGRYREAALVLGMAKEKFNHINLYL